MQIITPPISKALREVDSTEVGDHKKMENADNSKKNDSTGRPHKSLEAEAARDVGNGVKTDAIEEFQGRSDSKAAQLSLQGGKSKVAGQNDLENTRSQQAGDANNKVGVEVDKKHGAKPPMKAGSSGYPRTGNTPVTPHNPKAGSSSLQISITTANNVSGFADTGYPRRSVEVTNEVALLLLPSKGTKIFGKFIVLMECHVPWMPSETPAGFHPVRVWPDINNIVAVGKRTHPGLVAALDYVERFLVLFCRGDLPGGEDWSLENYFSAFKEQKFIDDIGQEWLGKPAIKTQYVEPQPTKPKNRKENGQKDSGDNAQELANDPANPWIKVPKKGEDQNRRK